MDELISRQQAIDAMFNLCDRLSEPCYRCENPHIDVIVDELEQLPSAQPKCGKWIIDRSGAYCCSECMEPCASYVMMKPRDKFCKMCGSRNEVTT